MDDLEPIKRKIYELRGQRVMLDRDLADAYGVETKRLNEAVRRNVARFEGDDFMFRLTKDEAQQVASRSQSATSKPIEYQNDSNSDICLRSQFATTNIGRGGNRYLPYAFTELGVAMLSSVLRSETAIRVNREIMRAFVAFRHLAATLPASNPSADIAQLRHDFEELKMDIQDILADQNEINEDTRLQLELINQSLAELQAKGSDVQEQSKKQRRIGFVQYEEEKEEDK